MVDDEMNTKAQKFATRALPAILLAVFPAFLSAQSIWTDQDRSNGMWLEVLRPNLEGDRDLTPGTSTWFLGGRWNAGPDLNLIVELPFAHGELENVAPGQISEASNAVGNPYLGMEWGPKGSPFHVEFGARAPLADADEFGAMTGLFSDFVLRADAFVDDFVPVTAMGNHTYRHPSGFMTRLRVGPALWVATEDEVDSELFARYTAQAGYDTRRLTVLGGFLSRTLLTEEDVDFGERSVHQVGVTARAKLDRVQPGLLVLLPVDDDLSGEVDYTLGVTLGVRLN